RESAPDAGTRVTCFLPADPRVAIAPPESTGNIVVTKPGPKAKPPGAPAKPATRRQAKRPPSAEAAE
ncbi:MAG: hypothetical protein AAB227_01430, partial [Pseudomonadota bacterium]